MARRRFVLGLVAIAAVAPVLRGVYIVTVTRNRTISFDEFYYAGEARSIAGGNGFDPPRAGTLALGAGAHPPLTGVMLVPAAWLLDGDVAMRFTTALAGAGVVCSSASSHASSAGRARGCWRRGSQPSTRTCG